MLIKSLGAAIALSMLVAVPAHAAGAQGDAIARRVRAEMAQHDVPGVAIAIVRHGRPVRVEGFGLANIEQHTSVTPDTLFKTGALGMQFTATAVLLLAEDGKVDLDASIRRYMPELPASWQPVTLRQMLNHSSGLPATPNGDFRVEYTDAQMLDIIAHEAINFPAGTRWRFSYVDYVVLGQMITRVTGASYNRFLAERVFAPAGMKRARGIDEAAIIRGRAAGYERRDGQLRNAEWISATANSTADGSLYVSARDYAAWAGVLSRAGLMSKASWAAMAEPAQLASGARCGYGLGWYRDARSWWHGGTWQGFQTFAIRFPAQDLTVAVLANGEGADAETLARDIAGLAVPTLARTPAHPLADADPARTAQVRALLAAVAANRVEPEHFVDYATLDLTEMTALYAGQLANLGALQAVAPFQNGDNCGQPGGRYRARYANGVVEVRLSIAPDGRIGNLEIVPVAAWDAPL